MKLFGNLTELGNLQMRSATGAKLITLTPDPAVNYTANRTVKLPPTDADMVLVEVSLAQTLQNKTLDNTSILTIKAANLTVQDGSDTTKQARLVASSISTGTTRSYTLPDLSDTIVTKTSTDILQNKTLIAGTNSYFADPTDNTKTLKFSIAGNTAGNTQTIASTASAARTWTLPDATSTAVGTDTTQTLTNKSLDGGSNTLTNISLTTSVTGILTGAHGGTGVNNSATLTYGSNNLTLSTSGVTSVTLPTTGTLATLAGSESLSNKTLDNTTVENIKAANLTIQDGTDTTKQARFVASSISTGTTRSYTLPDASTTLVGTDATQTLTNKTLTSPVLNTPSVPSYMDHTEIATPATPAASTLRLYAKSDDNMYFKNSAGVEAQLVTSAGTVTLTGTQTLSNKTMDASDNYAGIVTPNSSAASQTITTGNTLFYPNLTVPVGQTYTINSGAYFVGVNTVTVNGTWTINGSSRIL